MLVKARAAGAGGSVQRFVEKFHLADVVLLACAIALSGLGLVMVYSASSVVAAEQMGDQAFFLKRQVLFVLVGFVTMFLVGATDYRLWVRKSGWLMGFAVLLLALVVVPGVGTQVNGATRWISMGGFRFQPAELAKIAVILYLTWALVRKGENVRSFTYGLLPMGIVAGVISGFLLLQPDFGNAVVVCLITAGMLFLSGARISYLVGVVLWALPFVYVLMMGEEYRRRRILAFLDPWADPQHTSYQILQSFTAFFQGGALGTGLGNSQEKLYYLPEIHTDFIAALVGEELGFVGIVLMLGVYMLFLVRGFRIASRAADASGFLLAAGCTMLVGIQTLFNLGVVMGLLPTKGLSLPFVSHGGSSIVLMFLCVGLLQSVARGADFAGPALERRWLRRWGAKAPDETTGVSLV